MPRGVGSPSVLGHTVVRCCVLAGVLLKPTSVTGLHTSVDDDATDTPSLDAVHLMQNRAIDITVHEPTHEAHRPAPTLDQALAEPDSPDSDEVYFKQSVVEDKGRAPRITGKRPAPSLPPQPASGAEPSPPGSTLRNAKLSQGSTKVLGSSDIVVVSLSTTRDFTMWNTQAFEHASIGVAIFFMIGIAALALRAKYAVKGGKCDRFRPINGYERIKSPRPGNSPRCPPNFTGSWRLTRIEGSMDVFMKDIGMGLLARVTNRSIRYGIGRQVIEIVQEGNAFQITNPGCCWSWGNVQKFLVGGGDQCVCSNPKALVFNPRWDGRVLSIAQKWGEQSPEETLALKWQLKTIALSTRAEDNIIVDATTSKGSAVKFAYVRFRA